MEDLKLKPYIELPCKVGDTVYYYNEDFEVILPYLVESLNIAYYNEKENYYTYVANCRDTDEDELLDSIDFDLDDIGKTVFLTKEESEKAQVDKLNKLNQEISNWLDRKNSMSVDTIIEKLEVAKSKVEWNYPIDYAIAFEEAIKILKDCKKMAQKFGIETIERQIPKKPINMGDDYASALCCPNCKQQIVNVWNKADYKPKYCHYCGQALDWNKN